MRWEDSDLDEMPFYRLDQYREVLKLLMVRDHWLDEEG